MDTLVASYATIDKVNVRPDKSGVDLDLTLQPTNKKSNARLGFAYEGTGFGLFVLPEVGDEVFVVFPGGDINAGCVVSRMTNTIDSIPAGVDHTRILLVGKGGHKLDATINANAEINITGDCEITVGGTANITADGNCKVESTAGTTEVKSASKVSVTAPEIECGTGAMRKFMTEVAMGVYNVHGHPANNTPPTEQMGSAQLTSQLKGT